MASIHDSPGTLDYLADAAHLLRTTAPETSAHLMSQRNRLLWEHEIHLSDIQKQHVCKACGNIMIPDHAAALRLESRKAQRQKRQQKDCARQTTAATAPTRDTTRIKVIQCARCTKNTRVAIPAPRPPSRASVRAKKGKAVTEVPADKPSTVEAPKAAANASSKKRAKNPKAGLQALLSGQKSQRRPNPLSLTDFMKK